MPKYAEYDPAAPQPAPVLAWYDADAVHYPNLPDAARLVEIPDTDWPNRTATPYVQAGALVPRPPGVPVTPPLTQAQALAALGAMLTAKEGAGVFFTPTGATAPVLFPTDTTAQGKYTSAWSALNTSPPLAADGDTYVLANGEPVQLSMADAKAMIAKALAYVRACFATYGALYPKVQADPTTDITQGWPGND